MIDSENSREARRQFPLALIGGLLVVLVVAGAVVMLSKSAHVASTLPGKPMAFGPQEQAYAANIHFSDIKLAKSENLLNQQFTYINGTVSNDGDRTIERLAMAVEFYDDLNNKEVALHDEETVIGPSDPALGPHSKRDFSVTLDRFPNNWNQQMPSFRTSGLVFQ